MNKSFKKLTSLLIALVLLSTVLLAEAFAYGDDLVAINSQNFPDATFREAVSEYFDENMDGFLSEDERSDSFISVTGMIDIEEQQIKDLKGIEFFTNLKNLRCGGIGLETLDVSSLVGLTSLTCQGNELTSLDLSRNHRLVTINCADNNLQSLELPISSTLRTLFCYANSLTSIDTYKLATVTSFRCDQNELTSIDMTPMTALTDLNCSSNHFVTLDLSTTALTEVTEYMIGNQTITLNAIIQYNEIIVPFTNHGLTAANYRGCNLDALDNGAGFEFDKFTAFDISEIENGIDYECFPMLEGAENMTVHIDLTRDFRQVNFYTDSSLTERISKQFVSVGDSAAAPAVNEAPQCKSFDCWSDDISNVTDDMNVYIVWTENHDYKPFALGADKDTVTVKCRNCNESYTVSFISIVNTTPANDNFDTNIDVVSDGYINAKDYSVLAKLK